MKLKANGWIKKQNEHETKDELTAPDKRFERTATHKKHDNERNGRGENNKHENEKNKLNSAE